MDIVIVVTGNAQQQAFWQKHLKPPKADSKVLVVQEDWPGGAGNGLGTLYAYQKATDEARKRYDMDLLHEQEQGASVSMYHTAGKGTRLAPLPGCEQNNKSAVKLPGFYQNSYLTILEAVIRQTSVYATERKGRLSVFWGDQVFIPNVPPTPSQHHADILACLAPLPTREEWQQRGLSKYGLIAMLPNGSAKLLEKVSYDTVLDLQKSGVLTADTLFGTSLGSFSISHVLLRALLHEFARELHAKQEKMDSDPHFWMPLTLDEATYASVMAAKGMNESAAKQHLQRMQALKTRVQNVQLDPIFFSAVDVGHASYWWDFGTLKSYYESCLKLTHKDAEGQAIRAFFGNEINTHHHLDVDQTSYLQGCHIKSGRIRNSVVVGVTAEHVDISDCLLIGSTFNSLQAQRCLLYHVEDHSILKLAMGSVRADSIFPAPYQHVVMYTQLDRDSNQDWSQCVNGNSLSYAELFNLNEKIYL